MAANTLALGTSTYALLDSLNRETVTKSGSSTTVRSSGGAKGTINDLGIGVQKGGEAISNINVFGSLDNFSAGLGTSNDTLNIFGSVQGSRIFLDNSVEGIEAENTLKTALDGNDLLNISGNIEGVSQDNLIYAGAGKDTIRIAGSIDDAFVFLGAGDDVFTAKSGRNVDIKGDSGNDSIQFRGQAEDVRINAGSGFDTVVLAGLNGNGSFPESEQSGSEDEPTYPTQDAGTYRESIGKGKFVDKLVFSTQGRAAVEMGSGSDSLILGNGWYNNASFDTGTGNDTISITATNQIFSNTYFQLGNSNATNPSSPSPNIDKLTSAQGNNFDNTSIFSNNSGGDSLVFGSTTFLTNYSNVTLGAGDDLVVFGNNSTFWDSRINTGSGSDTLVFGSGAIFENSSINLGEDSNVDYIRFNTTPGDLSGLRITGASQGDVLYIGATSYTYSSVTNDFYDVNNQRLGYLSQD